MKKISMVLPLLALVACENTLQVEKGAITGLSASKICAGEVIAGVTGTANCSGGGGGGSVSVTEGFYIFASRADVDTLDFDALVDDLWSGVNPLATRSVATLKDAQDGSLLYVNNYSVIPRPLYESDGRYEMYDWNGNPVGVPEKRHYLETIISNRTSGSRADVQVCGASGDIEARIADCRGVNGQWSFYSGAQYGQKGEGDWSQVAVVDDGGTKYEVWRDERTKLIWSDRAANDYNWYRASGYSKPQADSIAETEFTSEPGDVQTAPLDPDLVNNWGWSVAQSTMQPSNPISVCPDVVGAAGSGQIAAGGGHYTNYDVNPETAFKGNLNYSHNVVWKLPSIDDWKLADVNGIRKVLPNMDYGFWSSSSYSYDRYYAWYFGGDSGYLDDNNRIKYFSVRCVAFVRD